MQIKTLTRYIPLVLAIAGIFYLANQPSGRLIPFAIGFLCLSLLFAYYGFVKKDEGSRIYYSLINK